MKAQIDNAVAVSVDKETATARSRLVHLSLLDLNLRLMENWRSLQMSMTGAALDHESTLILMAIIVIGGERLLRSDLESELETLEKPLPEDRLSKANLSSIAAATGINRETVRRKVNELQKLGLVVRDRKGIRTKSTGVPFESLIEVIGAQLDAVTRTLNQLSKLGVLRVID